MVICLTLQTVKISLIWPKNRQPRTVLYSWFHMWNPQLLTLKSCFQWYIRSLNQQQRHTFDTVLTYCRNVVKCPSDHHIVAPQLFITGGAGAGKSHLMKLIHQMATQTFKKVSENPEKPSVLLLGPTGISAINISGTTINIELSIPVDDFPCTVSTLSDTERYGLRNQLSELKNNNHWWDISGFLYETSIHTSKIQSYFWHSRIQFICRQGDNCCWWLVSAPSMQRKACVCRK